MDKLEEVAKTMYEFGSDKRYFNWDTAQEKDKEWYRKEAKVVCSLFQPKPDEIKLPTEDEIKEWVNKSFNHLNPEYVPFLLMGVEALYTHLGGKKFLEVNYGRAKP